MKIAIVGSRAFQPLSLVVDYVNGLPDDTGVVSGAARGVDTVAAMQAFKRGLPCVEYRADWSLGKGAGFARNGLIVAQADKVVAFWDGKSNGTLDTLKKAVRAGKPAEVRYQNGDVEGWVEF